VNLGAYEQEHNNLTAAIAQYKKVIALTRDAPTQNAANRAQAFSNMAFSYRELKDYAQARASFEQAVQINSDDARSWLGIGLMAQKAGERNAAIEAYTRSLSIAPLDWGYLLLAQALNDAGRPDEALTARQRAGAISQNLERAQKTADNALAK
jgi:tetratricopeptide (TPR) repeat protein